MVALHPPDKCAPLLEIWRRELVLRKGAGASEYLSKTQQRDWVQWMESLPTDSSSTAIAQVCRDWLAKEKELEELRNAVLTLRRRALPIRDASLEDALLRFESVAASRLLSFVTPYKRVARDLLARWHRDRENYPFFTQAVRDLVFQPLHPILDRSARVDKNARADLEILIHLIRADALVTNETGFMACAFDAVWKPRGKLRFSSTEFAQYLTQR